ncbi:hypothetical protein WI94_19295 [Burkholderia vietnamiensis]|nr:hypothetical protein WI94_19295 [Burkholderia vietnamiensis]
MVSRRNFGWSAVLVALIAAVVVCVVLACLRINGLLLRVAVEFVGRDVVVARDFCELFSWVVVVAFVVGVYACSALNLISNAIDRRRAE